MPGWKDLAIAEKSKSAGPTQDGLNTVKNVTHRLELGPYTKALEMELVVLKIDGKYPTDRAYPSAVTVSLVHKPSTLTPDAAKFIAYVKTTKAKTLLSSMGGVPALE